ncbi:MAG TPA: ABC transporter permease [Candidatus Kapabacteria bacterium]|nr:ABC transporter permease [Candidatus Kapabacteria bacterium]
MLVSFFIAKKYFFAKRQFQFITIISLLSFLGIAIGVAILIVVTSIFNGFQSLTKEQFLGFDPHIQILSNDNNFFSVDSNLSNNLKLISGIKSIQQSISFEGLLFKSGKIRKVEINSDNTYIIKGNIYRNINRIKNTNLPKISIGIDIANSMNLRYNDTLTLLPLKDLDNIIAGSDFNDAYSFSVGEIYNSNIKDYDANLSFISLQDAQLLTNPEVKQINQINVRLENINDLNDIKLKIARILPKGLKIKTWEDLNPVLFSIMKMEKVSTFSILGLIVLLAIFNIFISLTMTVYEKRKDIGVFRSLGANQSNIYNIFFNLGTFTGILGTLCGLILGLSVLYLQENYKIFSIDSHKYIIDAIPFKVDSAEIVFIVLASMLLSSLAALYPSYKASVINIYKSIRTE